MVRISALIRSREPGLATPSPGLATPSEVSDSPSKLSDLLRVRETGSGVQPAVQPAVDRPTALDDRAAADVAFRRAVSFVEEIAASAAARSSIPFHRAVEAAEALLDRLEMGDALFIGFFRSGGEGPKPTHEIVNVGIVSLKIGLELKYPRERLRNLGVAALLCELWKASAPAEILGKSSSLTSQQRAALDRHRRQWLVVLEKVTEVPWVAEVAARTYQQPREARDDENAVEECAMIVYLADLYERLVHPRPFRGRFGTLEALKEILQTERKRLPHKILKSLIRGLSVFPVGSPVRLNTGEIGRVVAMNADAPLRPVVAVLIHRGQRLESPMLIDLSKSPFQHIQDSATDENL